MSHNEELERAQRDLGDCQGYSVYESSDVLAHCYEHPAYERLQARVLSGERADWLRNSLEAIWNWAAACIACRALGINPDHSHLVSKAADEIEHEMAMGGDVAAEFMEAA
ncbi:hypothetical protein [Salinicola halophilus]|uniref:hypothetical protein n=1 Tax=Salinicola halophilus TaxID=184065 RepID=UPI000DA23EBC|nr:hypothetical protein [Salinicola halophilus]